MHFIIRLGLLVLTTLFASKNYDHRAFQLANHGHLIDQKLPTEKEPRAQYKIGFVEFDDQGKLFEKDDTSFNRNNDQPTTKNSMDLLLDDIKATASAKNTLILVYAHGWHHNAKDGDGDLENFKITLARLGALINQPKFRKSRRESAKASEGGTYDDSEQVVGIYLGWRGRSAPSFVDYLTFWGRKPAAQRVGTGEVANFLVRLNRIYRDLNEDSRAMRPFRFTGLIVAGHSFGGALVMSAVESQIQSTLASLVDGPSQRRPLSSEDCPPSQDGLPRFPLINGLGDLVILINPAIESAVYEPIWALSTNKLYSPCQSPIIMTVSAENDTARTIWFRAAQALSITSRATRNNEESQLHQALGDYKGHVTHKVTILSSKGEDSLCPDDIQEGGNSGNIHLGAGHRFRGENGEEYCFRPTRSPKQISEDNPFIVVRATKDVANGHESAFQPSLDYFLIKFIAATAEKRQKFFELEHSGRARESYPE